MSFYHKIASDLSIIFPANFPPFNCLVFPCQRSYLRLFQTNCVLVHLLCLNPPCDEFQDVSTYSHPLKDKKVRSYWISRHSRTWQSNNNNNGHASSIVWATMRFSYIFCHVSTSYCSCSLKPRGANDLRVRDVSSNGTGLQVPQRVFKTAVGLIHVGKTMSCLPSPSEHRFYRWYKLTIPRCVVYGIVLPTL